jgi:tRNA pseudouridine38-40 synthase
LAQSQNQLKLTIQYDGTDFCGFELQPGQRSVRGELQKAFHKLYKKPINFINASRTDAGVHALGQVISFKDPGNIPVKRLAAALNGVLPEDIRVVKTERRTWEVGRGTFNARFSAKRKTYEYLIYNGDPIPVHLRKLAWHVKPKLDLVAMKKAAKYLVGKHDFSSFCAAGSDDTNFVRKIHSFLIFNFSFFIWDGIRYPLIKFRVTGTGFLYKMVRNIVGTLVEVGLGKRKPEEIKNILAAKNRRLAGKTAPAQGLCLVKICYN